MLLIKKALECRSNGYGYRQIGLAIGRSTTYAHELVETGMRMAVCEPAERMLKLQLARCDALFAASYKAAMNGDPKAIERALKIMRQMDSYYGIGASSPKR